MKNKQKQIQLRDVQDVLDIIGGRWRGAILASLCDKEKRFNELKRDLGTITPRTLAKELKYLEMNKYNSKFSSLYYNIINYLIISNSFVHPYQTRQVISAVDWLFCCLGTKAQENHIELKLPPVPQIFSKDLRTTITGISEIHPGRIWR